MSETKRAKELAEQRYETDYYGILLNAGLSVFSSVSASSVLAFVESVPMSRLPVVFTAIFFAQILPKILVELNKKYAMRQAKIKGYKEGVIDDNFGKKFMNACKHTTYF